MPQLGMVTFEDLSSEEEVPKRRPFFSIPFSFFVPVKWKTKTSTMKIPPSDDIEGVKRVNEILSLMAMVDGREELKTSWRQVRKRLAEDYHLRVMREPETWGTEADQETKERRKEAVVEAVTRHNGIQKENKVVKRKRVTKKDDSKGDRRRKTSQAGTLRLQGKEERLSPKVAVGFSPSSTPIGEPPHPHHVEALRTSPSAQIDEQPHAQHQEGTRTPSLSAQIDEPPHPQHGEGPTRATSPSEFIWSQKKQSLA
ncbi:hypothetical protein H0H93_015519 [Arthromyces matolae]|nr:hypothetical protein H0H93_015519 [Arthromyces matolae]